MGLAKHITRAAAYASSDDFRRIFHEKMDSLYLLAFLLTADHRRAEQCFVSGLEDAVGGNPVFREWAHSWARRMIIQNAVRLIKPRPADGSGRLKSASVDSDYKTIPAQRQVEISAILGLEPFERVVYVVTVLEHMVLAWKAALATSLVNDGVAFEIRHRVESTLVMRLESFLPPFAKTMSLSREVEQRWSSETYV